MPSTNNSTTTPENATSTPLKLCYANKCRILLAKGILRAPVACAKGRNICPGCIIEGTRQRKTATAEIEIMEANTPNQVLAPILDSMITPISIKQLRQLLQHLPTMNFTKRDDSIFGVIRYIANSLGLRLTNAPAGSIDETLLLHHTSPQPAFQPMPWLLNARLMDAHSLLLPSLPIRYSYLPQQIPYKIL
mmetsp:Transcript_28434/g.40756  ORF Transcript_28434/g.40756 Transcript_28434/m.40756 type:complete len:191 (+) Transcript_28434:3135-3707(+)